MTEPLSTSSSKFSSNSNPSNDQSDFFDDKPWSLAVIGSLFIVLVSILFFEYNLRSRKWTPTVTDSPELWVQERRRASKIGKDALILIGGSRIQLGIDLNALEQLSPKKPIQLAIDGSNFYPVLKNLAEDTSITGDVIIDISEASIVNLHSLDKAQEWVEAYEEQGHQPLYKQVDQRLSNLLTSKMITKMEGAKPAKVINDLVFHPKQNAGIYLITHSNRSRDADYSKVKMPDFYINRVIRHSLMTLPTDQANSYQQVLAIYEAAITNIPPLDLKVFEKNLDEFITLIQTIEQRGGRVIIVRMPTSKLIWQMDLQRCPIELFWQKILARHPTSIHGALEPTLNKIDLPDGSHLDQKDKTEFTQQLYKIIIKNQFL